MQVVYIDTLFLINFTVDYLMLLLTAKICSVPARRWRIAVSAAAGGVYAVLAVFDSLSFLRNPFVKVAVGVAMVLTVFGGKKELMREIFIFFAVSAAAGGAIVALSFFRTGGITGGALFVPVDLKLLLFSFLVIYPVLTLVFRRTAKRRKSGGIVTLTISAGGRSIRLRALVDTGNSLTDPMTGNPVIVTGPGTLQTLFSQKIQNLIQNGENPVKTMESLYGAGERRFSLIPYKAVGIESGMLLAFRPDHVEVGGVEKKGMLIALSPNKVSDGGVYSALLGT